MSMSKGQNVALTTSRVEARVRYEDQSRTERPDLSAYLLRSDGKVAGDSDMIFYNQPSGLNGAITLDVDRAVFSIDTASVPSEVARIAICLVSDGGVSKLGRVTLEVNTTPGFEIDLGGATEAALILGEFYRRDGAWKFRAVGQGFDGGLAPLARSYGIDVAEPAPLPTPAPEPIAEEPGVSHSKIDLRKHKVGISLQKHGIASERAEVLFVIDASGSMARLYQDGTVQETVERIVPVALRLDDDGRMDTWFYASDCRRVDPLDATTMVDFIRREMPMPGHSPNGRGGLFGRKNGAIGYGNNEPVVMEAILGNEKRERRTPLLVLFLTDGGIDPTTSQKIKQILRDCSGRPIFWQYIGVGRADYGVLRDLDTIDGRVVDNAGFFAVDDLSRIDDDELYDRILSEFPLWLKEVRKRGILR